MDMKIFFQNIVVLWGLLGNALKNHTATMRPNRERPFQFQSFICEQ